MGSDWHLLGARASRPHPVPANAFGPPPGPGCKPGTWFTPCHGEQRQRSLRLLQPPVGHGPLELGVAFGEVHWRHAFLVLSLGIRPCLQKKQHNCWIVIGVCQKTPLSELSCHDPPHFPRQLQPNFVQEDASDRSGWGDWWWTGPDLRDAAIGRRSRLLGSGFKG